MFSKVTLVFIWNFLCTFFKMSMPTLDQSSQNLFSLSLGIFLSLSLCIDLKLPQEILLCIRAENYCSRGSTGRGEVHRLALSPSLKSRAFSCNFEGNQLRSIIVVEKVIKEKLSSFQWVVKILVKITNVIENKMFPQWSDIRITIMTQDTQIIKK